MKFLPRWHPDYNVPIVNNHYQNPHTGAIETTTEENVCSGPPAVRTTWINMNLESDFRISTGIYAASIDEVFVAIADHVREGAYSIVSISASEYSMTVVCSTTKSRVEMGGFIQGMKAELGKDVVIPPEEKEEFESWVRNWERENAEKAGSVSGNEAATEAK